MKYTVVFSIVLAHTQKEEESRRESSDCMYMGGAEEMKKGTPQQ
jgi:hypothetical protein